MAKPRQNTEREYPDAWARFERAVDVVAKSPPQHRKISKDKSGSKKQSKSKSKRDSFRTGS
jgi:hypothetical protein